MCWTQRVDIKLSERGHCNTLHKIVDIRPAKRSVGNLVEYMELNLLHPSSSPHKYLISLVVSWWSIPLRKWWRSSTRSSRSGNAISTIAYNAHDSIRLESHRWIDVVQKGSQTSWIIRKDTSNLRRQAGSRSCKSKDQEALCTENSAYFGSISCCDNNVTSPLDIIHAA